MSPAEKEEKIREINAVYQNPKRSFWLADTEYIPTADLYFKHIDKVGSPEPLTVRNSQWEYGLLSAGSIAMIVTFLCQNILSVGPGGIVLLIIFFLCALFTTINFFNRKPKLIIDGQGLYFGDEKALTCNWPDILTTHISIFKAKSWKYSLIVHYYDPGSGEVLEKKLSLSGLDRNHTQLAVALENIRRAVEAP